MIRDLSPVTRSYAIGVTAGAVVGLVLCAVPFVPWQVAAGGGLAVAVVGVLLVRSLLDPAFLAGGKHDAPWSDREWGHLKADDSRQLHEMAGPGPRRRLRVAPEETQTDMPVVDFLVSSRRAGER